MHAIGRSSIGLIEAVGPGGAQAPPICVFALWRLCADCDQATARPWMSPAPGYEEPVAPARLRSGQVLYRAGQVGDALFALRRGLVKESLPLPLTKRGERIVRLVASQGVTGLSALVGEPHRHSALAIGDGLSCRIPVARLQRALEREPSKAQAVWYEWQRALDDVDDLIGGFAHGPAQARLARLLVFLLEREGSAARLRRRDAAELIGVAPVSVTRLITRFKREGLIEEEGGRLVGCDRPRLVALASGDHGRPRAQG